MYLADFLAEKNLKLNYATAKFKIIKGFMGVIKHWINKK